MLKVQRCCCCIDLEPGCKVLAILGIVKWSLYLLASLIRNKLLIVVLDVLFLACHIAFLRGIIKKNVRLVKTYVIAQAVLIGLGLLLILLVATGAVELEDVVESEREREAILQAEEEGINPVPIFIIAYLIGMGFNFYFWVVAFSYYKSIDSGPAIVSSA